MPAPTVAPPVVLLHGFAGSYELTWRRPGFAQLLADEGRTVVGIDLLGHGEAPKPHDPDAYLELEARAGAEIAERAGAAPLDAVGFSLGARTLLALAAAEPARFRRLVVAGVGDELFSTRDAEPVARALEGEPDPEDQVARHLRVLADEADDDRAALAACLRRPAPPLDPAALGAVEADVLVVVGDQDELVGSAEGLAAALAHAAVVRLARTDHARTPESFAFFDAALAHLAG